MKDEPLISVIIPCYNQARFLPETLDSVVNQDGVKKEIIVIDDGSTEDIAGICGRYGSRVVYLRQENAGAGAARNRGLDAARGDFIYFLDGDDLLSPGLLRNLRDVLSAHPAWGASVCTTRFVGLDASPIAIRIPPLPPPGNWFRELGCGCFMCVGSILIRRSFLPANLRFDTTLKSGEDWDFWVQWTRTGVLFGVVPDAVFLYRLHPAGKSKNPLRVLDAADVILRRAREADARVTNPAPEWKNGAPADDLTTHLTRVAAGCVGRGLASGDAAHVTVCLERLVMLLNGVPLTAKLYGAMLNEVATLRGLDSPLEPGVWRCCYEMVLTLESSLPTDSPVRPLLPELVRGLSGVMSVEEERDLWRNNYRRLALAFPIKQILALRRFVLGIPPPKKTL